MIHWHIIGVEVKYCSETWLTTISLSFGLLNVSIFSPNNFHTNSVPDLSFLLITVPSRITDWLTKTLPELNNDYDNPLEMRRENTTSDNIELHPSMIPFVTQFKVEEDDECNRKVLVTYANINHNKLILRKCGRHLELNHHRRLRKQLCWRPTPWHGTHRLLSEEAAISLRYTARLRQNAAS